MTTIAVEGLKIAKGRWFLHPHHPTHLSLPLIGKNTATLLASQAGGWGVTWATQSTRDASRIYMTKPTCILVERGSCCDRFQRLFCKQAACWEKGSLGDHHPPPSIPTDPHPLIFPQMHQKKERGVEGDMPNEAHGHCRGTSGDDGAVWIRTLASRGIWNPESHRPCYW